MPGVGIFGRRKLQKDLATLAIDVKRHEPVEPLEIRHLLIHSRQSAGSSAAPATRANAPTPAMRQVDRNTRLIDPPKTLALRKPITAREV